MGRFSQCRRKPHVSQAAAALMSKMRAARTDKVDAKAESFSRTRRPFGFAQGKLYFALF
jgi:hypothetical protein